MKNKKIIAGTALFLALSLGAGSTLALWTDQENIEGSTITAGNMDISVSGTQWYDASVPQGAKNNYSLIALPILEDYRSIINLEAHKAVPGDTIASLTPVTLTLEGDNLHVETGLNTQGVNTGDFFDPQYVTVETMLYSTQDGTLLSPTSTTQFVTPEYVAAHGLPAGAIEYDPSLPSTYSVATFIHFAANTPDSILEQTEGFIANSSVYVKQLRGGATTPGGTENEDEGNNTSSALFEPYDFVVQASSTSVAFSWPEQEGASSYNVEYNVNNGEDRTDTTEINTYSVAKSVPEDIVTMKVQAVREDNTVSSWSEPSVPDFSIYGSYPESALESTQRKERSWIPFATDEVVIENGLNRGTLYYSTHKDYTITEPTGTIVYRSNGNHETQAQVKLKVNGVSKSPSWVEFKLINPNGTVKSRQIIENATQVTYYSALGKATSDYKMVFTADFYDGDKRMTRFVIENINPHYK